MSRNHPDIMPLPSWPILTLRIRPTSANSIWKLKNKKIKTGDINKVLEILYILNFINTTYQEAKMMFFVKKAVKYVLRITKKWFK